MPVHNLSDQSVTCIAKSCSQIVGLREVASALTSQLPRPLLQRVCAKVNLSLADKVWLAQHSELRNISMEYWYCWFLDEEFAYRRRICNEEVDRRNNVAPPMSK